VDRFLRRSTAAVDFDAVEISGCSVSIGMCIAARMKLEEMRRFKFVGRVSGPRVVPNSQAAAHSRCPFTRDSQKLRCDARRAVNNRPDGSPRLAAPCRAIVNSPCTTPTAYGLNEFIFLNSLCGTLVESEALRRSNGMGFGSDDARGNAPFQFHVPRVWAE
jgi:hypothetical protein